MSWYLNPDPTLVQQLAETRRTTWEAYCVRKSLIREQGNREYQLVTGTGKEVSVYELIQNGADQIRISDQSAVGGRIHLHLAGGCFYCANEGAPIDRDGIDAILSSDNSFKKGFQIGHFGVGFKSVLNVSDHPEFLSRALSFRFDEDMPERLRELAPEAGSYPRLRFGKQIFEPVADPLLDAFNWATTVIRLPLKSLETEKNLKAEFQRFDAPFVIFSDHVRELTFESEEGTRRIQRCERNGVVEIEDGAKHSHWRVFRWELPIGQFSDAARNANHHLGGVKVLPLNWGVPLGKREGLDHFWAFFPTQEVQGLRGILNAPWQLDDLRQHLVNGPFNRELLAHSARLVAEALPALFDSANPAHVLDLLPAPTGLCGRGRMIIMLRGLQSSKIEAKPLHEQLAIHLYDQEAIRGLLPTWTSMPKPGSGLALLPGFCSGETIRRWVQANRLNMAAFCHPSILGDGCRRAKALALGAVDYSAQQWLEAVAGSLENSVQGSRLAMDLAKALKDAGVPPAEWGLANIVLAADNQFHCIRNIYLPAPGIPLPAGFQEPCEALRTEEDLACLRDLGATVGEPAALLKTLLSTALVSWPEVWPLLVDGNNALQAPLKAFIERHGAAMTRVRNLEGEWVDPRHCFLPGPVVGIDGARDRAFTLDTAYHQAHLAMLRRLLFLGEEATMRPLRHEAWFARFLGEARTALRKQFKNLHGNVLYPQDASLNIGSTLGPGPLDLLENIKISPTLRVGLTESLLGLLGRAQPWEIRYTANVRYPTSLALDHPLAGRLLKHGWARTSVGEELPLHRCFSPTLVRWGEWLPVPIGGEAAKAGSPWAKLPLRSELGDLEPGEWDQTWERLARLKDSERLTAAIEFCLAAMGLGKALPPDLPCKVGPQVEGRVRTSILLAADVPTFQMLAELSIPAWLVPEGPRRAALGATQGMKTAALHLDWDPEGQAVPIASRLVEAELPPSWQPIVLQACRSLRCGIGSLDTVPAAWTSKPFLLNGDVAYHETGLLPSDLVRHLEQATEVRLNAAQRGSLIGKALRHQNRKRSRELQLHESADETQRLLAALGAHSLRQGLPTDNREGEGPDLAARAFRIFGSRVLSRYRHAFSERGFIPPVDFQGTSQAMDFCEDLGFSLGLAGEPLRAREAWFDVNPPRGLKPLHQEYQVPIVGRIVSFLAAWSAEGEGPKRGLLSLPTGSGKTRVAVEALVKAMLTPAWSHGPVIWIAQTEELCEQAVLSWTQAWEALADSAHPLRISRFWGATNNGVLRAPRRHHLVVCTYQTLRSRLRQTRHDWMRTPSCVIIDEAHGATAPSYTEILRGVGITHGHTACPLIGLTATPFRSSMDSEATRLLVNRFEGHRFDKGVFLEDDPYAFLQSIEVLSQVDHLAIEGHTVTIADEVLARMEALASAGMSPGFLPAETERELAGNLSRTQRILAWVLGQEESLPVIIFATSVDHAHLLAERLNASGRPAAAISGETPRTQRQMTIEQFKLGEIRVLVNYSVLATGFDAPKVGAVVIARPVFSPVLYQQMIGRGLRGTKNGGTERCMIVNVEDNITNYGRQWAFRTFEHLWNH